jgi:putative phosphoesterase
VVVPERRSARRVAVLSDVHGNAVALEAVVDELAGEEHDLVVFGGDLTWGSLPEETLELVQSLTTPTFFVRGNAERALLEPSAEPTERERWMAAHHSSEALAFLATFADRVSVDVQGLGPVCVCHGSPRSDNEIVTPKTPAARIRAMTAEIGEHVVVSAHTHIQFDRRVAGIRSINAGSVGLPYEERHGAFWALLGPDVEHRVTDYPLELAVERFRATDDPRAEVIVEMMENPPSRGEVIEEGEKLVFSD